MIIDMLHLVLQTAVKSCKQVNKNLSDMAKELDNIRQVTTTGDLPEKFTEAEEAKIQVEGQLLERVSLRISFFFSHVRISIRILTG